MSPRPGTDVDLLRRWGQARRRAAREHHPDRGGDCDRLVGALAEVDARFEQQASAGDDGPGRTGRRTWRHRGRHRRRRTIRLLRSALPRAVPGSRRWADL